MAKEKTDMEGIVSEITAGMVLFPTTDADRAWNGASQRAVEIVKQYEKGYGIFQVGTERSKFTSAEGE